MNAARLYTPQVLASAVSLARYPMTDALPLRGSARSASCGSTLEIGLALNGAGRVETIGVSAQACAIGQAAAALFAEGASGRAGAQLAATADAPAVEQLAVGHALAARGAAEDHRFDE